MEGFYDGDLKDIWDSDLDPVSLTNFQMGWESSIKCLYLFKKRRNCG